MDAILKWAGAKRWQVPQLKQLWRGRRVVELFCGSCAVTFGLQPAQAILNDANPHLINFYTWVQRGFVFDLQPSPRMYYSYRDWFNQLVRDGHAQSSEAAQLFYYLNCHSFNNLCRFNRAGEFNVPLREREHARDCAVFDADAYRAACAHWSFSTGDFRDVAIDPDDFVYADPPYDEVFTGYTGQGWTRDDATDLALLLIGHPGPVVLMNSATPWTIDFYTRVGFRLTMLTSSQKMHASRGRTDRVLELMATNFPVDSAGCFNDDGVLK